MLGEFEEQVHAQFFIKKFFENQLVALEGETQALAAGLFPSGVQGLNKVNSKLWEFTNLLQSSLSIRIAGIARQHR